MAVFEKPYTGEAFDPASNFILNAYFAPHVRRNKGGETAIRGDVAYISDETGLSAAKIECALHQLRLYEAIEDAPAPEASITAAGTPHYRVKRPHSIEMLVEDEGVQR